MNKPKYKFGDIVYDRLCNSTELIGSIAIINNSVWYRTMIIDGRNDGKYDVWHEDTLDEWYNVIGNVLEDKHDCSC